MPVLFVHSLLFGSNHQGIMTATFFVFACKMSAFSGQEKLAIYPCASEDKSDVAVSEASVGRAQQGKPEKSTAKADFS